MNMPNPDDSRVIVSAPPGRKPTISTSGLPGMPAGRRGLPLAVPLPFLLTGDCAAALFGLLLPWVMPEAFQAPEFPHVLALVHVATLGWLTMTIMGGMQSREEDAPSAHMPAAVYPSIAAEEGVDHQEVSHVFHCMQCELQFHMDMAVTSRKGSQEIVEGVIRVRLDPRIKMNKMKREA